MGTQFLPYKGVPAAEDPYAEDVILLLHWDDGAGSWNNTDYSNDGRELTGQGPTYPDVSTAQFKFGSHSLYSDGGTGNLAIITPGPNAEYGDFPGEMTIEGWVYPVEQKLQCAFGQLLHTSGSAKSVHVGLDASGYAYMRVFNEFTSLGTTVTGTTPVPLNQWTFLAVTRDASNELRLFTHGTLEGTTYNDNSNLTGDLGRLVTHGNKNTSTPQRIFNGYIDEVRMTRRCRYTASFTPPTTVFPNP